MKHEERRRLERLQRTSLECIQLERLNALLAEILPQNAFYRDKFGADRLQLASMDALAQLPFTTKDELIRTGAAGDLAANLTYPVQRYVRYHRTSGTRGRPLVVLDTAADWQWWISTWQYVLDAAEMTESDRAVMAFSFGPFIGFWSAYDAAVARGAMVVPSGGLSTPARLELIRSAQATVVFCTPSYALHMAECAEQNGLEIGKLGVRHIIVAGEPGGSVPGMRDRIENAWQARVVDHCGASEVGPWGYQDVARRGLHIAESEFIAEFESIETREPARPGELAELILTTLGRFGSPVVRYRTGDLVRYTTLKAGENQFVLLEGGVLGRADDMMIVRGVNIFPSSIEQILCGFPDVIEYRMTAYKSGQMDALRVEVEDRLQQPERIAHELQMRLGLKIQVQLAESGSLPRFEGKGKRFIDQRGTT